MFYWSLKSIPELQRRSAAERCQAQWQIGVKPLFDGNVWIALFVSGLLMLWGLEALTGSVFMHARSGHAHKWLALWAVGAVLIILASRLPYRHAYLKAMRPHIRRVSFDHSESWITARFKGALMSLLSALLLGGSMVAIDWAINEFDGDRAPQLAALKDWPKRIPAAGNGFFTAAGLLAEPGAAASEAGERWVAAVNAGALQHEGKYPAPPQALKYQAYAAAPAEEDAAPARKADADATFCDPGREACWKEWQAHKAEVTAWVAANRELLARYQALQQYPQWQTALATDDPGAPLPAYDALLKAQGLYLAAAMEQMSKGLAGKKPPAKWQVELFGRGLDMMDADIAFARTMLAGTDRLPGKMAAATLLARDLALLAETMQAYPQDVRPHWEKLEKMFAPLSEDQLSVADSFKFEEKLATARGQESYGRLLVHAPHALRPWLAHHYRKDATAAVMVGYWEEAIRRATVADSTHTPPLSGKIAPALQHISPWAGYLHNQGGKYLLLEWGPGYYDDANRLYDLNAFNALLRLRAELAVRHISAAGVPGFLAENEKALRNPETGKPFEWDAAHKQLWFTPATDFARERFGMGAAAPGRAGMALM